jgi:hypothetical protein
LFGKHKAPVRGGDLKMLMTRSFELTLKDEAQTALFKDPVRTAL